MGSIAYKRHVFAFAILSPSSTAGSKASTGTCGTHITRDRVARSQAPLHLPGAWWRLLRKAHQEKLQRTRTTTHAKLQRTRNYNARETTTHAKLQRTRNYNARETTTHAKLQRTL